MRKSRGESLFQAFNYALFAIFTLMCVYPFIYILFYSLSDARLVMTRPVYFMPAGFTLVNFINVFELKGILNAFFISAARSVCGTTITLIMSSMFAYILTKKELPMRKSLYKAMVFTMYVSVGLIPWYITMATLGLKNNFLLYIIPGAIAPFNVILIKTYIESIHPSLEESAHIDGANVFKIFTRIILPLSLPVLAAVGVFTAVGQWNSWTDNFFLVSNAKLKTVQLVLREYLTQSEILAQAMRTNQGNISPEKMITVTPMSIRMTTTIVVTLPILFVYPFLQRYFVKGIMLGAVKG